MRKINHGFGLIGILITVAIIAIMVWGAFYLDGKQNKVNQIQSGEDAIKQAQDAANQERQSNLNTQTDLENQDAPTINYHGAVDSAKGLK